MVTMRTSGTTATSWRSRIPSDERPCTESISPRSTSRRRTQAVDDSAAMAPTASAALPGTPRAHAIKATSARVKPTWRDPPPRAIPPKRNSRLAENSSPIAKRSSVTPSSASTGTPESACTTPKTAGPIIVPARRYPTMADCPRRSKSIPRSRAAARSSTSWNRIAQTAAPPAAAPKIPGDQTSPMPPELINPPAPVNL